MPKLKHEMICRFTADQKKFIIRQAKRRDMSQAEVIRAAIEKDMRDE